MTLLGNTPISQCKGREASLRQRNLIQTRVAQLAEIGTHTSYFQVAFFRSVIATDFGAQS
jgi:hypothetical protein